jgi:hypothetical protein
MTRLNNFWGITAQIFRKIDFREVLIGLGLVLVLTKLFNSSATLKASNYEIIKLGVLIVIFLVGIAVALINYLSGRGAKRSDGYLIERRIDELYKLIKYNVANNPSGINLSDKLDSSTEQITKTISENIVSQITPRVIASLIKTAESEDDRKRYNELTHEINVSKARILREIEDLSRRGNLNLAIGVVTTLSAAALLFISIGKEIDIKDPTSTLNYFIPRVSTVIFIEIFSFFF